MSFGHVVVNAEGRVAPEQRESENFLSATQPEPSKVKFLNLDPLIRRPMFLKQGVAAQLCVSSFLLSVAK